MLVVMVLIFLEVDAGEFDEKGEGGQRSDDYYSGRLPIGVLDSCFARHIMKSTVLYVLQQYYNSQFRS